MNGYQTKMSKMEAYFLSLDRFVRYNDTRKNKFYFYNLK
jgi:hypothetical protein